MPLIYASPLPNDRSVFWVHLQLPDDPVFVPALELPLVHTEEFLGVWSEINGRGQDRLCGALQAVSPIKGPGRVDRDRIAGVRPLGLDQQAALLKGTMSLCLCVRPGSVCSRS